MTTLLLQLVLASLPHAGAAPHPAPCAAALTGRVVPTEFAGNRIFALWHIQGHGDLRLYTDTGGGIISLYPDAAQRIGAAVDTTRWTRGTAHGEVMVARIALSRADPFFPPMPVHDSTIARLLVQPDEVPVDEPGITWDGRLGGSWFDGGVWTFDYPHRRLYFSGSTPAGPADAACWVPLGFQYDSTEHRANIFPRIAATIDGDTIQFLLDTGARMEVTASARSLVDPKLPAHRATSFIGATRFEQWRARHPEWLVVPRAEVGSDSSSMIRVPSITIGGHSFGPVWFTERPTRSFPDFMSQYTDLPVEGALGGSVWRYVTLIVDYPRARAAVLPSARHE